MFAYVGLPQNLKDLKDRNRHRSGLSGQIGDIDGHPARTICIDGPDSPVAWATRCLFSCSAAMEKASQALSRERPRLRAVAGQPPLFRTNTHSVCTLSVAPPPTPSAAVVVRFEAWILGCGAGSTNLGRALRHGVLPCVHRVSGGRKTSCARSRPTARACRKGESACLPCM